MTEAASLRAQSSLDVQQLSKQVVEQVLLSELSTLGRAGKLEQMEDALRPLFVALPKNEHGLLEPSAVRYALHRFFVSTRGWYVKGLLPGSTPSAGEQTSPALVMQDRVPEYIQSLFESHLSGQGLGLHELAAFAATLQDLVHAEAMGVLSGIYERVGISFGQNVTSDHLQEIVRMYLACYLFGPNLWEIVMASNETPWQDEVQALYPSWPEVALWAQDVQNSVTHEMHQVQSPFQALELPDPEDVVVAIGNQFGAFQDQECQSLKDSLVEIEYQKTGRVLLSDFYRGGLNSDWQFSESVQYLRMLGALDDSDPARLSVIIPNYLSSQSNCLASSSFYSVCCLSQCESLLSQLERAVGGPSASPSYLAALVASMPSETMDAPRNLSSTLLQRLEEIADQNHGQVPIHGRLFAQFLHHAYPRECPFPHEIGTTQSLTPEEWLAANGEESLASPEEMMHFVVLGSNQSNTTTTLQDEGLPLPWITTEELVVGISSHHRHHSHPNASDGPGVMRQVGLFLAAAAALWATSSRLWSSFHTPSDDLKLPRYIV
eukprot:CAMPEP_0206451708 /NCGR_PEP_ID=MMETSP0324_2-20121206/19511_1 /ASSEMBLY_ACC=CAM_ASM_000836 /TAXON_ID=2866 /ORGANISM="Crypthecodinium cohnii, Strain Seligo" /LENGTH=547 /DNA_ID=CAMNT_0053921659 /DNA_START=260 /DNA_END=1903 /DNA_ORIENTATION=+